jgi:putative CocE/NonD family hydrolase
LSLRRYAVRRERNLQIPMDDGVLLAADMLRPETGIMPALLGFYPYHKEAGNGADLDCASQWFAECGYASLLVDLRGTGCSEGSVERPFDATAEAVDGARVVDWVASQDWCDGNVGVWGISYGAIAALSIAARQPAALKAIAPIMGCPDPYSDWFYPGGCEACQVPALWGTQMVALQLAPPLCPDPDGRFQRLWRERLETQEPYVLPWRRHVDYETCQAAAATEVERITVPTFVIGGWRDVFAEASVRTYERVTAPRKLLMGPWRHELPDEAGDEPYEYVEDLTRWWDRWLRGEEAADIGPPVTLYVQGKGSWKAEQEWPLPSVTEEALFLTTDGGLETEPCAEAGTIAYEGDPTVGACAGYVYADAEALDQSPDDRRSLTWTGAVLSKPLEITGSPEVVIELALDSATDANLVARLCDVAPDGTSTPIATGWLAMSGARTQVRHELTIPIQATAYQLVAGHRLRLALSCADFPRIWPTAENPRILAFTGAGSTSRLRLPVTPASGTPVAAPRPRADLDRRPHRLDSEGSGIAERHSQPAQGITARLHLRERSMAPGLDATEESEQLSIASVEVDRPDQARVTTRARIHRALPDGSEATVDVRSVATLAGTECTGRVELDGKILVDRHWQIDDGC